MLTNKNFEWLINDSFNSNETEIIMCRECPTRVSNAFIATKQQSPIIKEWINEYHTKYGNDDLDKWGGLSVDFPDILSKKYPSKIIILPEYTFLPFDYFYTDFFTKTECNKDFSNSFGIHLWDTEQQKRGILPSNLIQLKLSGSMFWRLFKDIVEEDVIESQLYLLYEENKQLKERITKLEK
jgi:hypothetical protein